MGEFSSGDFPKGITPRGNLTRGDFPQGEFDEGEFSAGEFSPGEFSGHYLTLNLNFLLPSIVFHNKICVFIMIFRALSFLQRIHDLCFT